MISPPAEPSVPEGPVAERLTDAFTVDPPDPLPDPEPEPDPEPLPEPEPPPEEDGFLTPQSEQELPLKLWEDVSVFSAPQVQVSVRLCWLSEIDDHDP